tara:strand:+ start:513 stop:1331 length:819 start_codon:yes stop_codon:yes gene_type:complete
MATYAIGDIQGCYKDFKKLLKEINFNKSEDTLWLAGDLVNRGPKSFDVIKYIMDLGSNAITVLGNHDFYLIASYYKIDPWPHKNNAFDEILSNKDGEKIIDWLRNQKIIHLDNDLNYILVHAGIYPNWKIEEMLTLAQLVEKSLRGEKFREFIKTLWSNTPDNWHENLNIEQKLTFSVNVFTRMRYLKNDFSLDFDTKSSPEKVHSKNLTPWYELNNNIYDRYKIIIGHWSTLGFRNKNNIISIDTGCAWGNKLTAIKLLKNMDIKKYEVSC